MTDPSGHVIGSVIQYLLASGIVVVVAVVIGFRPTTGPLAWVATLGLLILATVAVNWLSVGMGLVTDSVETASNLPQIFLLLMFISSAFVPTATLPDPLRWFAEYQPWTPIVETLRVLLYGGDLGSQGVVAVAWCLGLAAVGFVWSRRSYDRDFRPRP